MNKLLTLGILLLAGAVFAAPVFSAALLNKNDRIWDAETIQAGLKLKGKYKESPENGLVDQTLEVEIENATPNTVFSIQIRTFDLGTMTTNARGRATFRIDRLGLRPGPDGRPAVRRRVEEGDRLRVFVAGTPIDISARFTERPPQ